MEIQINNVECLNADMEEYKRMFPHTYTTMGHITNILMGTTHSQGWKFGIEVSNEWQNKCYAFELCSINDNMYCFNYLGVWKI